MEKRSFSRRTFLFLKLGSFSKLKQVEAVGSRFVSLRPRPKNASALGSSLPSELTHWIVKGGCKWANPSKGGFEHEVTNLSRSAMSSAENACRTDQKSRKRSRRRTSRSCSSSSPRAR